MKILIVDDHPIVRHGLKALIEAVGGYEVVAEGENQDSAHKVLSETHVDVAVIDLSLSKGLAFGLIAEIRAKQADLPILVVSMHDASLYADRVRQCGANGYVMKHEAVDQVIEAIQAVTSGGSWFINLKDDVSALGKLSDRELEIFELIGRGESTRQVAESLGLSVKTIETHRDNIKGKLALKNANELVHHAVTWFQSVSASGGNS